MKDSCMFAQLSQTMPQHDRTQSPTWSDGCLSLLICSSLSFMAPGSDAKRRKAFPTE